MKNYQDFFERGYKYSKCAGVNWDKRRSKLQAMFVHPKYAMKVAKRQRIMRLIGELEDRVASVFQFIRWVATQRLQTHLESLEIVVQLECPSTLCVMNEVLESVTLPLKHYIPGKERCTFCGAPLLTKEDLFIDKMLWQMGIPLS